MAVGKISLIFIVLAAEILGISAQNFNVVPQGSYINSQIGARLKMYREAHELQRYQLARRQELEVKELQEQHRRAAQQLQQIQQQQHIELQRKQQEQLIQVQRALSESLQIQPLNRVHMDYASPPATMAKPTVHETAGGYKSVSHPTIPKARILAKFDEEEGYKPYAAEEETLDDDE